MPARCFRPSSLNVQPARDSRSLRDTSLAVCQAKGINTANIVVFLFVFDYPVEAGFSCPYLTLLRVFLYRTDGRDSYASRFKT
jgi:hypothetical protein